MDRRTTIVYFNKIGSPAALLYVCHIFSIRWEFHHSHCTSAMNQSKDFRAALLLVIPAVWIIFQLLPKDFRFSLDKDSEKKRPWEMSQIQFLPASLAQKEVLISLYELKNVPVNRADAELLTIVPGIGPALAERIVAERERSGFFHAAEDLIRVRGIGEKRAEQFQSYLRFD